MGVSVARFLFSTALCLSLAACQGAGPRTDAILESENAIKVESDQEEKFVLVEMSRALAEKVSEAAPAKTTARFISNTKAAPIVIGAGDVLDISIVSTNEDGFIDFTQSSVSPVSSTPLPPQQVGADGNVNVPPVGRVRASGKSVQQFETFLARRLGEVLVNPSVIVNLTDRRSARVSVIGAMNAPGAFSINQESTHLVDVLTLAGGPSGRVEDLEVTMTRRGQKGTVGFGQLLSNPRYNVHLRPGDVINVELSRKRYTVLGASNTNVTQDFSRSTFSLADALGRAGGLANRRADKRGVFLFREAPKSLVATLGADISAIETDTAPTIFQFDMSAPQNDDVIYISDSAAEEVNAAIGAITAFVPAPVEYVRNATIATTTN